MLPRGRVCPGENGCFCRQVCTEVEGSTPATVVEAGVVVVRAVLSGVRVCQCVQRVIGVRAGVLGSSW
jgi:hypothetical protein